MKNLIESDLLVALSNLSGEIGRQICTEICESNIFTKEQYEKIVSNIIFNNKNSICEYFGTVHYYYVILNK